MVASRPERGPRPLARIGALPLGAAAVVATLIATIPSAACAQVEARPLLEGTAYLGDEPLNGGMVVLHHVSQGAQGELDSMRVGDDGRFRFALPQAPDPARQDIYFASVRHDGVLYFGPAITQVLELDSLYEVHAYDTLLAPPDGIDLAMESRSLFLEPDSGDAWRVTDLFQLRNDRDRTVVARDDGSTWRYPLPEGARDVIAGEGDLSLDAGRVEEGQLVVSAALSPGQRLIVARYRLDSPFIAFPTPGRTETIDVLVLEPGPPVEIDGLERAEGIELEGGATFRRYNAVDWEAPEVALVEGEVVGPPPVKTFAVILAMVLTLGGLLALRGGERSARPAGERRQALLVEVARLDEDFASITDPSEAQKRAYGNRRSALVRRLRSEA